MKDKLRGWPWLGLSLACVIAVGLNAPQQLGVLLWSLSKLCIAAYLGYWIDRSIFPYARPDRVHHNDKGSAMIRRAVIIAAVVIGLGLGV